MGNQFGDTFRRQSDPVFVVLDFLWNTNAHREGSLCPDEELVKTWIARQPFGVRACVGGLSSAAVSMRRGVLLLA